MKLTGKQQIELARRLSARNFSSKELEHEDRARIYAEECKAMGIAVPASRPRMLIDSPPALIKRAKLAVGHLVDQAGICTDKDAFDYVGLFDALDTAKAMAAMQRAGAGVGAAARKEKLKRLREAAEHLKTELFGASDEVDMWVRQNAVVTGKYGGAGRYPIDLGGALDALILRCAGLAAKNDKRIFDYDETAKWLVGVELPSIYKAYFGEKASITQSPYPPYGISGPYVRFGMAAMAYLGEKCKLNSFETYWKRRRTFKPLPAGDFGDQKKS